MTSRVGDYSDKRYLYKVYKRGYSSTKNKYVDSAANQYMASVVNITSSDGFGSFGVSYTGCTLFTTSAGGQREGTAATDPIRKMDIRGITATFQRSHFASFVGTVYYYYAQMFDYQVYFDVAATQVKLYKKGVLQDTQTLSSSYDYIRMRESAGTFYIDRSSDGSTWTNWSSFAINFTTDIISTQFNIGYKLAVAGAGNAGVQFLNILITDKANQFLTIEDQVIDGLKFTTDINTPASTTTLKLNYSPLSVPSHLAIGNNIEVYANFYDWSDKTSYEPILDENGDPILDENSQPIIGKMLTQDEPETISNLRFSGYIEDIEYNYDDNTISIKLVSHGELLANTLVRGTTVDNSALSQLLDNATLNTSVSQYQTFTLFKQTKIDALQLKWGASGGGAVKYQILSSTGTVLGETNFVTWGGALSVGVVQLGMLQSITLEPGTYRLQISPSPAFMDIRYQNTDVYPDGSWTGGAGDMYFNIITRSPDYDETITGNSDAVINSAFTFLNQNYTLLYKGSVDVSSFSVAIQSNLDTVGSLIDNLQKQMDTGWWWHIDPGTGELRFKAPHTTPDHLLVLGRDFIGLKLNKTIGGIKNQAIFTGGEIATNSKLTVALTDTNSISLYKYGLSIESNEKVTRYDSAGLLVANTVDNNNEPRYTTDITVSAALYNIETFRIGDVVKISNGDTALENLNLNIASIAYEPDQVTLSLDTAPANINRTVDALRRELHNQSTVNASGAV